MNKTHFVGFFFLHGFTHSDISDNIYINMFLRYNVIEDLLGNAFKKCRRRLGLKVVDFQAPSSSVLMGTSSLIAHLVSV